MALLLTLAMVGLCLLPPSALRAQTRVNDRDLEAMMQNLRSDTKAFRPKFDSDIRKRSIIRNTSDAKAAIKLMETFVRQTDELPKRFKKDRNGGDSFRVVQGTAEQVDGIVNSAHLSQPVKDQWRKIRAEVNQIAAAYNMPLPFGQGESMAAAVPAGLAVSAMGSSQWLRISVFANVPLAGADIAVYDVKGKRLFEKKAATNNRGVYPAPIANLPRDFRVTATSDGARLLDSGLRSMGGFTLVADVRNFDPDSVVYINPATTLAAHVADKLPNHDLMRAQDLVRRFLVLPPHASLGAAMRQGPYYQSPYFSETRFLTQAQRDGGMDRFVNDLTSQALRQSSRDSFIGERRSPAAVGKFIVQALGYGVLGWVGGGGIGWAAESGGLTTPGATKKDIDQLQEKLAGLQGSVDNLSAQMKDLSDEIKAQLTEIQYTQYVQPAISIAAYVDTVEEELSFYAQDCPPIPEDVDSAWSSQDPECPALKARISRKLEDNRIGSAFKELSDYMRPNGTAGHMGMIRLYSQSLGQRQRFFRPADSTKMQGMFDYWYSVQAQAANLKTEDWHLAGKQNSAGGRELLQNFLGYENAVPPKPGTLQNTLAAEEKLMFPAVPDFAIINTRDRTMWLMYQPWSPTVPCANNSSDTRAPSNFPYIPLKVHGLSWSSPSLAEVEALTSGWKGGNLNQWLIENSRALPPDSPTNPGFMSPSQVKQYLNCQNMLQNDFWSRDVASVDNGVNRFYVISLANGKPSKPNVKYPWAWRLPVRVLSPGEQYYWYPNQ